MPDPDPLSRPRLRPGLRADPSAEPGVFALSDARRMSPAVLGMSRLGLALVELFDGSRTLPEVAAEAADRTGVRVPTDDLAALVRALDDALFLDGQKFRSLLAADVRKPSCIGCYPPDPAGIRRQAAGLFTGPGGPGMPGRPAPDGRRLRAVLVPHMDYARGGVTYGWGFKELAERTDARLFVIVATSHYSPHRFTLTRAHFETPLGVAETDRAYVDRIAAAYGPEAFADPAAHILEHSIELEVVLLQYLFADRGPIRIVPLLCGPLADCVDAGQSPGAAADVRRMAAALRAAEAEAGEPVCYVISGDLAHIGPKFGDPEPVSESDLTKCRAQDEKLLDRLAAADPEGYFDVIATEGDARRICGLPPTWLTLDVTRPRAGKVLHYNRFVHPAGDESVSFAAAAFYD